MSVLVLGLNYKAAPVSLLERVAVASDELPKALASLVARDHVLEAAVLSTCNRVEVYAHVTRYHAGLGDLRNFFADWGSLAPEEFTHLAYEYYDEGAAAHLFTVACGLDSMVVGERQIHLQVKEAFRRAEGEGAAGRVLRALFRRALRVGRRARGETAISAGASSMVDVGLAAAQQHLGDLRGRRILIVGAGKMGGMAAARLVDEAASVVITNRTADKAQRLAARVGGRVLPIDDLVQGLADADLVLASTGAPSPVISADTVTEAMSRRADRPLLLLDLAVPRDVERGSADVPGVTVLDIDAIRALVDTGETGVEATKVRALVEEEVARFRAWNRGVEVEPTIAALRARAEGIRTGELERLASRLASLDDRQRSAVEALTKGIVNTLLHDPSVRLKAIADGRGADLYAAALRELFDLPAE